MTTTIPAGGTDTYLPDRYDRLRSCAGILASDPAVENAADELRNGQALRLYIDAPVEDQISRRIVRA